ncbi:MAG: hypothetical protein ACRENK_14115 [Gemmatimonadaceae bacterium]
MPATPFHLGPGLLVKAAAPQQFSMAAYSLAQVVIDIESGFFHLRRQYPVHREMHTFVIAGLIGLLSGLIVSRVGVWLARPRDVVGEALAAEYRLWVAVPSGIFGGLLHVLIDGVMYTDIRPFLPFSGTNPLYGLVTVRVVYMFCVLTAVVGAALLLAWEWRPKRL